MIFSSAIFLCLFLPLALCVHSICLIVGEGRDEPRQRIDLTNCFLLLISVLFYAWGEPFFVFLMVGSIVFTWALACLMMRLRLRVKQRMVLTVGITTHIMLLFTFKYLTFAASQLGGMLEVDLSDINLTLPIGISFFTFQLMSYLFDVYYGKMPVQKSLLRTSM